jgi:hypothetical protein
VEFLKLQTIRWPTWVIIKFFHRIARDGIKEMGKNNLGFEFKINWVMDKIA